MTLLPVANKEAAAVLNQHPVVALDMGFSGTSKSCGIASVPRGGELNQVAYHFASAAKATAEFFQRHGEGVLIVEAPLSAAFDLDGDPCARGDLERAGKPRWWNLRAGASMALAALYFCRRLHDVLPEELTVHLIEGFVVGEQSGEHSAVAARLARAFRQEEEAKWHEVTCSGERISIAEWFGHTRGHACPVILQPEAV